MSFVEASRRLLAEIEDAGLRRTVRARAREAGRIDFSSNDYLGLSEAAALREAMCAARSVGSGGSRLLAGAHPEHEALELGIAAFVGRERALLFSSGYMAAMGAVHTLSRLVTTAYSDEFNHACVIDALRLTRMQRIVYPHLSLPRRVDDSPAMVVTESVFGMTGERADIGTIVDALGPRDVLLVDEARAVGVSGPRGAGLAAAYGDPRIVVVGTLSKAFGCSGGFVAGPEAFIELLLNTARTFMFDTSMPPPLAAAAHAALRRIVDGDDLRAAVQARVAQLEDRLMKLGLIDVRNGSIIVPILLGDAARAVRIADRMDARGVLAPAIRPPTVPMNTSRLRLSVRANHRACDVDRLCDALVEALAQ